MEKKPRKVIESDEAVSFVTGLGERLCEDADTELKNDIQNACMPLRKMIDACITRPKIDLKDSDYVIKDGIVDPEIFFTLLTRKLFADYQNWNRRRKLDEFMHEQQEFRQWVDARKAELADEQSPERSAFDKE
jgi:hypothetical protein